MKRLISSLSICLFAQQLHAEPLNFHGVDWAMTREQMISALEEKEYSCKEMIDESPLGPIWNCYGDFERPIQIMGVAIIFPCHFYNGCIFPTDEILKELGNRYDSEATLEPLILPDGEVALHYWLIKGADGDMLKLYTSDDINHHNEVHLLKGTFGEKLDF